MSIREAVADAVVEVCGTDRAELVDGATLESLDIDSLDLIEVGMIIEQQFDVQLQAESFQGVHTFGGAVEVFERAIGR
jgi:acyl carrier protein